MKVSRPILYIISALLSISCIFIFFAPVWYFANTTITNGNASLITKNTIDMFDTNTFKEVTLQYKAYNYEFKTLFAKIFEILVIITFSASAISLISTTLTVSKKIQKCKKYIFICKILSILVAAFSLLTLISAIIFSSQSTQTIVSTMDVEFKLSIRLTTEVYLFSILQIASGFCSLVSHNTIKFDEEE